jgi:hypothetical protein
MNQYTEIVASDTIACSKEDFEQLKALMDGVDDPDREYHGMVVELGNELHMFSEEDGVLESVPEAAMKFIGTIIQKANSRTGNSVSHTRQAARHQDALAVAQLGFIPMVIWCSPTPLGRKLQQNLSK